MTIYREFQVGGGRSPFGFLGPLLILAIFFTALFFIAKGIFSLFSYFALIFLIITLILDHKVVTDFLKFVLILLKENTLMGVLAVVLTFFGYPFVIGYLFFKAIGRRSIKKVIENVEKQKNTFTEYEEVVEEDDSFLELPPINKKKEPIIEKKDNGYDDVF